MTKKNSNLEVVMVPAASLRPAEYNPRKASPEKAAKVRESIERFGFVEPIIVNRRKGRENVIVGGWVRWLIAKELGMAEVPAHFVDLTLEYERELNLRLNKNFENESWDWDLLANFESEILEMVGFSREDLDDVFGVEVVEDDFDAESVAESVTKPVAQRGDVFKLGTHRLMCGDSTKREEVDILMGGEKADLVFTDPPYNVDYDYVSKFEGIRKAGKQRKKISKMKMFNDKKSPEEFEAFLYNVFKIAHEVTTKSTPIYVCHATKTQEQFFSAFKRAGWHFSQTIIWLKERIILALGQDYHRVYEPIMFGWKEGEKHYANKKIVTEKELWDLDRVEFEERLDVWYEKRDASADYIHPTQKPVRLAERALHKSCPRGGAVLDLFNGSGSTMLACEQLNRRCFAMELDPRYVDVAILRYEKMTGKKVEKVAE